MKIAVNLDNFITVYRHFIPRGERHVRRRNDGKNLSDQRNAQTLQSEADTQ